jgi:hypothetical protein
MVAEIMEKTCKDTCEHLKWTIQEKARYDKSFSPPKLYTRKAKICNECGEDLGELPTRLTVRFRGRGTNDRRFLRGETTDPYGSE